MADSLRSIAESMLGDISLGAVHYHLNVLILDHAQTIALVAIALVAHFRNHTSKSTKITTGILAGSYVMSSAFLYAFSFLIDDAYKDYSLYLSYSFLNSMVVMCALFAHAYYRIRFSFSSDVACWMVLVNTFMQFYVCVLFTLYDNALISYDTLLELGALYSISVNVTCWFFTLLLAFPHQSEIVFNKIKSRLKPTTQEAVTC